MTNGVFLVMAHFGKGAVVAKRLEHRIIAVTQSAADRPDQSALNGPFKDFLVPIGPREHERGTKPGMAGMFGICVFKRAMCAFHRHHEIAAIWCFGPIGGVDTGLAVQRSNLNPRIVGQSRQTGGFDSCQCFDPGVADESRLSLFWFGQVHLCRADDFDTVGGKQLFHFFELTRVVGGHQNTVAFETACHALAASWAVTSSPTPFSARSRSWFI
mmetsp:Transcript_18535/g.30424  ORF Transcript_18535/g.30424 Transcript_18535/m.30424 type:complete len:214 (-) Transcript_18535:5082-5723(-)